MQTTRSLPAPNRQLNAIYTQWSRSFAGCSAAARARARVASDTAAVVPRQRCVAVRASTTTSTTTSTTAPTRTQRMFDKLDASTPQAGGAGGGTTFDALLRADAAWHALRNNSNSNGGAGPAFVTVERTPLGDDAITGADAFDAVVCGGTLGVFLAAALAQRGHRVAVVEAGPLRGRAQEWNISRKELHELVEMGLLTPEEEEAAIAIEFNPVRIGFHGGGSGSGSGSGVDVWTRDVLNLGVRPDALVQAMRRKVEAAGGAVFERARLLGVAVHPNGAALRLDGGSGGSGDNGNGSGARTIHAQLVLDCMGHGSPIVRQARAGARPDGICLVVGGCASGFDPSRNTTADVIYTAGDSAPLPRISGSSGGTAGAAGADAASEGAPLQLFWEAFPSSDSPDSRTTYMFTYCDAQPFRPRLLELFEHYWDAMPRYQGVSLDALEFKRLLFAFFPTYKASPLPPAFDRVLQVGDASGVQSPLSFGGFGALTRHAPRLATALDEALRAGALSKADLARVNAYSPALSAAWMLQRAMTAARGPGAGDAAPPALINRMLGGNFAAMEGLGDATMRPFLQDVLQFLPLLRTMGAQMARDPLFVPQLLAHVGLGPLVEWVGHVAALGAYSALHAGAAPLLRTVVLPKLTPREAYQLRRLLEAWEYGSGRDYKL